MRYKEGEKEIASSRVGEQIDLKIRKELKNREQKKVESSEKKTKKKQESGRMPAGEKSEKRELTRGQG